LRLRASSWEINAFYLQIIIGALIFIAVAFDQYQGRRSRGS